LRARSSAG